jgi:hypothetical protein
MGYKIQITLKGTSNNDGFRRVTTPVWIDSRL